MVVRRRCRRQLLAVRGGDRATRGPTGGSAVGGGGLQALPGGGGDGGTGEAELVEQQPGGGARAVVVDADDLSGVADDVAPAAGDAGLDADAGSDRGGDDRVAVGVVLLVEPFPAGHGHDAGGDPVGRQELGGGDGVLDLGAGADEDDVGRPVGVEEDVAAPADVAGVGEAVGAARHDGQRLPAQQQPGRPVGVPQDLGPAGGGLVGVGRPDHVQARDVPQRGDVLDRLMGGSVLPEADGVVGPHEGDGPPHQRCEPDGGSHVVAEGEERAAVGPGAAMHADPVQDGAHGVLTDAEVQGAPVGVSREHPGLPVGGQEARFALHGGVVGLGQVRGAAPQLGQLRRQRGEDLAGGGAGGDALRVGVPGGQRAPPSRVTAAPTIRRSWRALPSGLPAAHRS